jgi:hypothetical protein
MSDLLKSTLALQNHYLKQRVHAAVIKVAHEQRNAEGPTGLFARMVLADLKTTYEDFILDVATNPSVLNVLVLADDHNSVTSTQVTDDDIIYIVNGTFPVAAAKYAPQPEAGDHP